MKKVFIYNASLNKDSRVFVYVDSLIQSLEDKAEIFNNNPLNTNLQAHDGTTDFYLSGNHYQDENDDGVRLKHEILQSDVLILISPVYCHHVSSSMSIFIERMFSLWVHLFKLLGKPCIIVTSSESNGNQKVEKYLRGIIETLGANVVDVFHFINSNENDEKILENFTISVKDVLENFEPSYSLRQEAIFKTYKSVIGSYSPEHYEYKYWENNGLFASKSLTEHSEKWHK